VIKPQSSFPIFTVKNLSQAKSFYTNQFGFHTVFENEWYLHLATKSGIQIGFLLPDQPTQPAIFRPLYSGSGVIFTLEVENVDAAFKEATTESLNVVMQPRTEAWGQRHFSVKDPNGVYVDIVQTIKPTKEFEQHYETK
jgi:uncharacterized glyoxalase superfamily protein PhnB